MSQGKANRTTSTHKTEPVAKAVSPVAVGQIGTHVGKMQASSVLYQGKGYEAPMSSTTIHHCGSQRKHK
jgi:hypothetical protein